MDVAEAVARRMAVRAFKPDPVPGDTIRGLLEAAARAPSGGNLQPWNVYALTGTPLAEFKAAIAAKRRAGIEAEPTEYDVYPPNLWDPLRQRRSQTRAERLKAIGFGPNDPAGDRALLDANFDFFGAPVGIFVCVDRRCGAPQWSDLGMYMQTLMLLAAGEGLDTCPQEIWQRWPGTIAQFVGLPPSHMVFAGISLGYRDATHPLNGVRTRRAPLKEFATLLGF